MKDLHTELRLCVPEFSYDNGIAYEVSISAGEITFTFTDKQELSIYSLDKCELTNDFISAVMELMDIRLEEEINSNKLSWYYKYI